MRLPRCQDCGACCAHPDDPEWIELTRRRAKLIHPDLYRPALLDWSPLPQPPYVMCQRPDGRCVALVGEIGYDVYCAVYPERPNACRKLRRGSELCHAMIALHSAQHRRPW